MKSKINSLKRIQALRKKMREEGVDICFIDNPTDLFYLTGLKMSLGRLIVHSKNAMLFVDGRYIEVAKKQAGVAVALSSEESQGQFLQKQRAKKAIFDGRITAYDQYRKLHKLARMCHLQLN